MSKNSLKVVHIKKDNAEQAGRILWENVLKPKWEKRDEERVQRKYKINLHTKNQKT